MGPFRFALNPPGSQLPHCSAVLNGRGTSYRVESHRTTLSIKSVVTGNALYHTPQGRFLVSEDAFLILNDGQEYCLDFVGPEPTETLCPFLQPGFLEAAAGGRALSAERLLDDAGAAPVAVEFVERLYPKTGRVGTVLEAMLGALRASPGAAPPLEDLFYALPEALLDLRAGTRREIAGFPGLRPATRAELYRRLHRGRDLLLSAYGEPLTVAGVARAAHLSPFHFQRMFRLAFGRTPMRLLQERRLAAARRLLLRTDLPVTSICLEVGFESLGSFSSLFRRRHGFPPQEYRRRFRQAKTQD